MKIIFIYFFSPRFNPRTNDCDREEEVKCVMNIHEFLAKKIVKKKSKVKLLPKPESKSQPQPISSELVGDHQSKLKSDVNKPSSKTKEELHLSPGLKTPGLSVADESSPTSKFPSSRISQSGFQRPTTPHQTVVDDGSNLLPNSNGETFTNSQKFSQSSSSTTTLNGTDIFDPSEIVSTQSVSTNQPSSQQSTLIRDDSSSPTSTEKPEVPSGSGSCRSNGQLIIDGLDCTKFFKCVNGIPSSQDCPFGLRFSFIIL